MAATHLEVEVARPRPGILVLRYVVIGNISDLSMPPVSGPTRTDELWWHTCFEAFLRAPSDAAYYEFNFAPSTQWAAYRFTSYRSGMSIANDVNVPRIEVQSSAECYKLQAALELDRLSSSPSNAIWCLGLSAVIEETNGNKSYWALVHPPGKADFHHSDCFVHELAAAERP
jgi:hypothetical protein